MAIVCSARCEVPGPTDKDLTLLLRCNERQDASGRIMDAGQWHRIALCKARLVLCPRSPWGWSSAAGARRGHVSGRGESQRKERGRAVPPVRLLAVADGTCRMGEVMNDCWLVGA